MLWPLSPGPRAALRGAGHTPTPRGMSVLWLRWPPRACFTTPSTWWLSPSTHPCLRRPEQSPGARRTSPLAPSSPGWEPQVPPTHIPLPGRPGSPQPYVSCPGPRTASTCTSPRGRAQPGLHRAHRLRSSVTYSNVESNSAGPPHPPTPVRRSSPLTPSFSSGWKKIAVGKDQFSLRIS